MILPLTLTLWPPLGKYLGMEEAIISTLFASTSQGVGKHKGLAKGLGMTFLIFNL